RPAVGKDVGCDQNSGSPVMRGPLTVKDVGPSFMLPLNVTLTVANQPAFALHWASQPGAIYQAQSSADLVNWSDVGAVITAPGTTQPWMDPLLPPPSSQFYRVEHVIGVSRLDVPLSFALTNGPCASLRWNAIPGELYQVQVSTNLASWQNV